MSFVLAFGRLKFSQFLKASFILTTLRWFIFWDNFFIFLVSLCWLKESSELIGALLVTFSTAFMKETLSWTSFRSSLRVWLLKCCKSRNFYDMFYIHVVRSFIFVTYFIFMLCVYYVFIICYMYITCFLILL